MNFFYFEHYITFYYPPSFAIIEKEIRITIVHRNEKLNFYLRLKFFSFHGFMNNIQKDNSQFLFFVQVHLSYYKAIKKYDTFLINLYSTQ